MEQRRVLVEHRGTLYVGTYSTADSVITVTSGQFGYLSAEITRAPELFQAAQLLGKIILMAEAEGRLSTEREVPARAAEFDYVEVSRLRDGRE